MRDHRLLTPEEAAEFLGVTRRRMLQLPIRRVHLGDRTLRYNLADLYAYAGIEDPNDDQDPPVLGGEITQATPPKVLGLCSKCGKLSTS